MTNKYDDIIYLPRHVSKTRPQMPIIDRAAQFSPFAALTGHGAAIKETARLTGKRVELDENIKEALHRRLNVLAARLKEQPEIEITYFEPDAKKDGGDYTAVVSRVKKIDEYEEILIMADGTQIPLNEIVDIRGRIFELLEEDEF